jgi:hypothetical protein
MIFCREVTVLVQEIHMFRLELLKDGPLNLFLPFLKYIFGIEVWLIPNGIMCSKSLLDR